MGGVRIAALNLVIYFFRRDQLAGAGGCQLPDFRGAVEPHDFRSVAEQTGADRACRRRQRLARTGRRQRSAAASMIPCSRSEPMPAT